MSILRPASHFALQVVDRFYPAEEKLPGFDPPWPRVASRLRFLRAEESIWTGYSKHGKSLLLNQVMLSGVEQGEKWAVASFEMPGAKTLHRLVRQATGERCPDESTVIDCLEWLGASVFIYDHVGVANVPEMLDTFKKASEEKGVKQFIVDSLLKCGIPEDDYTGQKNLVDKLQSFAHKVGGHVHLVAHARKGASDLEVPNKADVRGASAITDLADNTFIVYRNRPKQIMMNEYYEQNGKLPKGINSISEIKAMHDCIFECAASREMGDEAEGRYGLYFHPDSQQFTESQFEAPRRYYRESR